MSLVQLLLFFAGVFIGVTLSYLWLRHSKSHSLPNEPALFPTLPVFDPNSHDLAHKDLRAQKLSHLNLRGSNLAGSDLRGVDASYSNMRWCDLSGARLTNLDLTGADLTEAELPGCDLTGVNLTDANLNRVFLAGVTNLHFARGYLKVHPGGIPSTLPAGWIWKDKLVPLWKPELEALFSAIPGHDLDLAQTLFETHRTDMEVLDLLELCRSLTKATMKPRQTNATNG